MGRSDIGMTETFIIVGQDEDGDEHFINYSHNECWLLMMIRLLSYKFKRKFRARYKKIYLKRFYD